MKEGKSDARKNAIHTYILFVLNFSMRYLPAMEKKASCPDSSDHPLSPSRSRGNLMSADCASREILKHVTGKWGVLVLTALKGGTLRFCQIRRSIEGVNERMLSQTLQWLERDGLVIRKSLGTIPPHVEYRLTDMGREVAEILGQLIEWIETKTPAIERIVQAATPLQNLQITPVEGVQE